jgi:tetratricopeptide (TPR) repeat protein
MKGTNILFALLLISCTTFAQGSLDATKKALANTNFESARKLCNEFLSAEKDPKKQAEGYFWLGETFYQDTFDNTLANRMTQARDQYNKGLALDKNNAHCLVGMGKLLLDAKNSTEAEKTFEQAIRASKDRKYKTGHPEIYMLVGDAHLNSTQPNPGKAVGRYTSARDAEPGNSLYLIRLGDGHSRNGDAGSAVSAWENAAAKDPSNAESYLKTGTVWLRAGKYDFAERDFQNGLTKDKGLAALWGGLTESLVAQKKYDKVTAALEEYVKLAGTDYAARLRFIKFLTYQAKAYDRSIAESKKMQSEAGVPDYIKMRANRWLAWSNFEKASDIERKAKEADKAAKAPFGDDWKMLMEESNKASLAMMNAWNADSLVYYDYEYAAKSSQALGNMDQAVTYYMKVVENDPTQACTIYQSLNKAYYDQKKFKEGLDMFDKRVEKGCKVNTTDYFYANFYSQTLKDYERNIKYADKYAELVPAGTDGFFYKAYALQQTDDTENPTWKAREAYEKLLTVYDAITDAGDKKRVTSQAKSAYKYLAYYAGSQQDLVKAKDYFQKVLAIDPNDKAAAEALQQMGN